MKGYYKLFPHCIPVKGRSRSIICNLHDETFFFITNDLFDILQMHDILYAPELVKKFGIQNEETINEYILVLYRNGCLFELNSKESSLFFPKFNLEFHQPSILDNAIIDIDSKTDLSTILSKLVSVGCRAFLLRIFHDFNYNNLKEILGFFNGIDILHIDLFISSANNIEDHLFAELFHSQLRLNSIVIFSCANECTKKIEYKDGVLGYLIKSSKKFYPSQHCPIIDPSVFIINIPHFTESIKYNNCLNKKIYIDITGNIRNCPSMQEVFGNIKSVELKKFLESNESFKELWGVKKDLIKVCFECEFRYICSDCRAFVEDPSDIQSKPLTCGYDPETGKWLDWEKNDVKEKAISHYFDKNFFQAQIKKNKQ
jgi:SPASM domain peptide maturase of grasp-with-spasm system